MATAAAKAANPTGHITWNEAGPEIESKGINLQQLRVSKAFMASCNDPATGRYVEATAMSALAAIAVLLGKMGGADEETDTTGEPDKSGRA